MKNVKESIIANSAMVESGIKIIIRAKKRYSPINRDEYCYFTIYNKNNMAW